MKKAIIIGATSGIGRGVAEALIEQGWQVAITGRRIAALEQIQSKYGVERVLIAQMDVRTPESSTILARLLNQLGTPDLFLYSAGIGWQNRDLVPETELSMVATNCEGMVRLVDEMFNHVKQEARAGRLTPKQRVHIAVITSVAGTTGMGSAPAYSATKKMQSTYISALCQLARMEHVPVRFSDIRPGFVATEILNPNKHYPMTMSCEKAVGHILRGLNRHRRIIIFDWRFKLLVLFWKLIPRPIWERITFIKN